MGDIVFHGFFRGIIFGVICVVLYGWWKALPVGTKSLIAGVHCFVIHPITLAVAWTRIYGFPWDPRIWVAFVVHDWGYIGCAEMDSPAAEEHVVLGARIMHWLFDRPCASSTERWVPRDTLCPSCNRWRHFSLYHSRFYAKKHGAQISKLCVADKAALYTEPFWFYILRAKLSGEVWEYVAQQPKMPEGLAKRDQLKWWHCYASNYLIAWVQEHKDLRPDTWTKSETRATDVPEQDGVYATHQ